MEIFDDHRRITRLPPPKPPSRHYKKNAASKEIFLICGVLFWMLGLIMCIMAVTELSATTLLVSGLYCITGALLIALRHYPNRAAIGMVAALICLVASVFAAPMFSIASALLFAMCGIGYLNSKK